MSVAFLSVRLRRARRWMRQPRRSNLSPAGSVAALNLRVDDSRCEALPVVVGVEPNGKHESDLVVESRWLNQPMYSADCFLEVVDALSAFLFRINLALNSEFNASARALSRPSPVDQADATTLARPVAGCAARRRTELSCMSAR